MTATVAYITVFAAALTPVVIGTLIYLAIRPPRKAAPPAVTREQLAKVAAQLRCPDFTGGLAKEFWQITPPDQRQWWLDRTAELLTDAGITVAPSPSPRAKTKDTRHD